MSSLYKRNGWYYAQFFDPERKPRQKQIALKTRQRREAERLRLELESDYERGSFDPWGQRPERSASDLSELGDAVAAFVHAPRGALDLMPHASRNLTFIANAVTYGASALRRDSSRTRPGSTGGARSPAAPKWPSSRASACPLPRSERSATR